MPGSVACMRQYQSLGFAYFNLNTEPIMNEIITQLIAAAIDADKIPGLDFFDMSQRHLGQFEIALNDGTRIRVSVIETTNEWSHE